ncbi:MAG: c-type cytochrome [Xanthomonadales bacterium]|nr:c-type cytochrome [Xanthomonadales bacterium]
MKNYDIEFLKRFSALIAGLDRLHRGPGPVRAVPARPPTAGTRVPEQLARTEARIRPVMGVYAGETGRAAMLAALEAQRAAQTAQAAFGGTLDGGEIYQKLCSACHGTGAGGAPRLERAAWEPRIAQGFEVLLRHSIEGYQGQNGLMPARGGNPALTDQQVEAAVRWMLDNLQ